MDVIEKMKELWPQTSKMVTQQYSGQNQTGSS